MNDEIPIRVMESDTPETNAKEWPIWPPNTNGEMFMVPSDFARKLERERNRWRGCAERLSAIVGARESEFHLANDIEPALAEFNKLKEDSK